MSETLLSTRTMVCPVRVSWSTSLNHYTEGVEREEWKERQPTMKGIFNHRVFGNGNSKNKQKLPRDNWTQRVFLLFN